MLINHANLSAMFTGFKRTFRRGVELANPMWDQIAMRIPSSTEMEDYDWLGVHPQMKEWVGDRVIESLGTHGFQIVNKTWENTLGVEREKLEDDKEGIYSPIIERMGEASALHVDTLVWDLLNNGRDAGSLGYDGVPFFAATHPHEDAGTVSNVDTGGAGPYWYLADLGRSTKPLIYQDRRALDFVAKTSLTDDNVFHQRKFLFGVDARYNVGYGLWQYIYASNQTLNATNLEAAMEALWSMTADNGLPIDVKPTHLIVPTTLVFDAENLIATQLTGGGNTNIHKDRLQIMVSKFLATS
jgi:phage major head subunit gpT-like protein